MVEPTPLKYIKYMFVTMGIFPKYLVKVGAKKSWLAPPLFRTTLCQKKGWNLTIFFRRKNPKSLARPSKRDHFEKGNESSNPSWKFNIGPEKFPVPYRKGSSSNHQFSGSIFASFQGVEAMVAAKANVCLAPSFGQKGEQISLCSF